jgi:hypothetical protein
MIAGLATTGTEYPLSSRIVVALFAIGLVAGFIRLAYTSAAIETRRRLWSRNLGERGGAIAEQIFRVALFAFLLWMIYVVIASVLLDPALGTAAVGSAAHTRVA